MMRAVFTTKAQVRIAVNALKIERDAMGAGGTIHDNLKEDRLTIGPTYSQQTL